MARFYGEIGFGEGEEVEVTPGRWEIRPVVRKYRGDVTRAVKNSIQGDTVNNDISSGHAISILADTYALEHFLAIKYVTLRGVRWSIVSAEEQRPRLILTLGGVYHGPAIGPADAP